MLAGGCFWGPQVVYEHVKGVTQTLSGYAGKPKAAAHSETAGSGTAGNAEAVEDAESVQLTFDPRQISLGKVLQIYFSVMHNPTELNYQGPDVGAQYRSEIFYANDEQKRVAEAYIAQLNTAHVFAKAIVTKVEALPGFKPAEASDQDFAVLHPDQDYIVSNRPAEACKPQAPVPRLLSRDAGHRAGVEQADPVTNRGRSAQMRGRRYGARMAARRHRRGCVRSRRCSAEPWSG